MFPFFNKKEFKIEDKKTGNHIYITQESFKTENDNYRIEGVSTSLFFSLGNTTDFFSKMMNPFNFMLPFTRFFPQENNKNAIEDKKKNKTTENI